MFHSHDGILRMVLSVCLVAAYFNSNKLLRQKKRGRFTIQQAIELHTLLIGLHTINLRNGLHPFLPKVAFEVLPTPLVRNVNGAFFPTETRTNSTLS